MYLIAFSRFFSFLSFFSLFVSMCERAWICLSSLGILLEAIWSQHRWWSMQGKDRRKKFVWPLEAKWTVGRDDYKLDKSVARSGGPRTVYFGSLNGPKFLQRYLNKISMAGVVQRNFFRDTIDEAQCVKVWRKWITADARMPTVSCLLT